MFVSIKLVYDKLLGRVAMAFVRSLISLTLDTGHTRRQTMNRRRMLHHYNRMLIK